MKWKADEIVSFISDSSCFLVHFSFLFRGKKNYWKKKREKAKERSKEAKHDKLDYKVSNGYVAGYAGYVNLCRIAPSLYWKTKKNKNNSNNIDDDYDNNGNDGGGGGCDGNGGEEKQRNAKKIYIYSITHLFMCFMCAHSLKLLCFMHKTRQFKYGIPILELFQKWTKKNIYL